MLIVMIVGASPVKTNLFFDTLDECLKAEDSMREEHARAFNKWLTWARANPTVSGYPTTQEFMRRRIGVESYGTCIPHGAISN